MTVAGIPLAQAVRFSFRSLLTITHCSASACTGDVNTVHNAFRDAEDALTDRTKTSEQAAAEEKRVAALSTYLRLANMRFTEGVTSYLEVLDADRNLCSPELQYVQTKADVYKSIVRVYRAFAVGWLDNASAESFQVTEPPERRKK